MTKGPNTESERESKRDEERRERERSTTCKRLKKIRSLEEAFEGGERTVQIA